MVQIIAEAAKCSADSVHLFLANSYFLDGKDVTRRGRSLLHMREQCVDIPRPYTDQFLLIMMARNSGEIKGIFPGHRLLFKLTIGRVTGATIEKNDFGLKVVTASGPGRIQCRNLVRFLRANVCILQINCV